MSSEEMSGDDSEMEVVAGGSRTKRARKRQRVLSSEGAVNHMAEFRSKMRGVMDTISGLGNKLTKKETDVLYVKLRDMETVFLDVIMEAEHLAGRLFEQDKLRELVEKYEGRDKSVTSEKEQKEVSVKQKVVDTPKNASYAVIVRSKGDETLSADVIKDKVLKDVRKEIKDIRVNAVRRLRNGLAIETTNTEDVRRIKECKKFDEVGLTVQDPRKIGPKVVIMDIPEYIAMEELKGEIYSKNLKKVISEKEFSERIRVIRRYKENVILEVPIKVRDAFVQEGRIFVGWNSCRVREIDDVQRCFRCFGVGHMARACTIKDNVCRKCGKTGHLVKDCGNEEECRNCKGIGKAAGHSVFARDCPFNVEAAKRARSRITLD